MPVRLQLLGGIRAHDDNRVLTWVPGQPVRSALLVYLAVEHEATRDQLARIFWPNEEIERARHSLSQTLYLLRRALGEGFIQQQGEVVRLPTPPHTDVAEFEAAVEAGELDRAATLYRGTFLKDVRLVDSRDFEEWVDRQRARLERLHRRLRRVQVDQRVTGGDLPGAIDVARAWVAVEPFEDEAQHRLIELLSLAGRRQEALAQYDSYERLLRGEELEPLDETKALVAELRAGRATPGDRAALEALALPSRPSAVGAPPTPPTGAVVGAPSVWRQFFTELKRRRVFRVAAVYLAASFVAIQAAPSVFQALLLPDWAFRLLVVLLILGFLIAVPLAWAFDFGPGGIQRTLPADTTPEPPTGPPGGPYAHPAPGADPLDRRLLLGGLVLGAVLLLAGAATAWLMFGPGHRRTAAPSGPRTDSIAVLPCANLTGDASKESFSDGIAEELLQAFSAVEGLSVRARQSSFAYKGRHEDVQTIAAQLRVGHLVECSLRSAGDSVRIDVRLADGRSGAVRQLGTYGRDASDVLAMEADIARATVAALKLRLLPDTAAPLLTGGTTNPQAREAYYRGLASAALRTKASGATGQKYFELATTLDPGFARAWAGRAFASDIQVTSQACWQGAAPPKCPREQQRLLRDAERFARQALKLDSTLADPHVTLARVGLSAGLATQRQELDEALRLEPRSREALYASAMVFVFAGDRVRARAGAESLLSVDPVSPTSHFMAAYVLNCLGESARADSLAAEGARLDSLGFAAPEPAPKWPPYFNRGLANVLLRNYDRAAEYLPTGYELGGALARAKATRAVLTTLASSARDGAVSPDERRHAILLLRRNEPDMQATIAAVLYLQLDDRDDLYRMLAAMAPLLGMENFALWDPVRNEPRFRQLVASATAGGGTR